MKLSLLGFCLLSFAAYAQDSITFRNDREGSTYYSSTTYNTEVWNALREVDGKVIISAYRKALNKYVCAYDINSSLQYDFYQLRPNFKELVGSIYYLRSQNEIDDVAAGILLNAQKVVDTDVKSKDETRLLIPKDAKLMTANIDLIASFDKKYLTSGTCFDDAYRSLRTDFLKSSKGISDLDFEGTLYVGMKNGRISPELYKKIEQARVNKVEYSNLTLKTYLQKKKNLRAQYPLKDAKEKSDFVTTRANKSKQSYRQRLMENYNDVQIVLMANIVKKLRKRLEASKVEILVYEKDDTLGETIPLEPMERFRFAIKLLRKEMTMLSLNSYFNGRTPDYIDLMTASYEIGLIPGSELEQIAHLQEIWNPTKSFWDKAQVWVTTFSTVATIVIPPPYGFIPSLVLVAIEATNKKDDKNDDNSSLF